MNPLYTLFKGDRHSIHRHDVLLASYPRSGNTWIRSIIAEICFGESGNSIADLEKYVPDIHIGLDRSKLQPAERYVVKTHHLPKSHSAAKRKYDCIHVLRDPRAVAKSYYEFECQQGRVYATLCEFVDAWISGEVKYGRWDSHTEMWREYCALAEVKSLTVKYEVAVHDPLSLCVRIAEFLNIPYNDSIISDAAQQCSKEMMRRKAENGLAFNIQNTYTGGWFVSASTQLQRINEAEECCERIEHAYGDTMKKYGYL